MPLFWSDVFDLSWEFWGDARGAQRVVFRDEPDSGDFSGWWLTDNKVVGAFVTFNRHDTEGAIARQWVRDRQLADPATLGDSKQELAAAAR